jgi:hypothetical protein
MLIMYALENTTLMPFELSSSSVLEKVMLGIGKAAEM